MIRAPTPLHAFVPTGACGSRLGRERKRERDELRGTFRLSLDYLLGQGLKKRMKKTVKERPIQPSIISAKFKSAGLSSPSSFHSGA